MSKVAIKVVGLRREHKARLLKRTNAKDDQAAAAGDDAADNDDDDADAIPTIYRSPFQSVAVLAFLYYFGRRFRLSP